MWPDNVKVFKGPNEGVSVLTCAEGPSPSTPARSVHSNPRPAASPRRARVAVRCVVSALLSQHGGPSADLHTARGPQDGPPPLLRQREAAAGQRHSRGPVAASRLETTWRELEVGLRSVRLDTPRGKGHVFGACTTPVRSLSHSKFLRFCLLFNREGRTSGSLIWGT